MHRYPDWKSIPVWRCTQQDVCGEQWAAWEENTTCPFCHGGPGERTGFTCGDVAEAAEKFGFDSKFPVHIPEPIPDVVQLSTLPPDTWIGLPVFHPWEQEGTEANWLLYDIGVIVEVYPDPDFPSEWRCRFVLSNGGCTDTLQYGPSNLWVPQVLAERLVGDADDNKQVLANKMSNQCLQATCSKQHAPEARRWAR